MKHDEDEVTGTSCFTFSCFSFLNPRPKMADNVKR